MYDVIYNGWDFLWVQLGILLTKGGLGLVGRALLFCSFLELSIMTGFLF